MKRRLKFISSIMALTSAFAMLAYGVYAAAIQRNVGISGTITFTSTASRASVEVYKAEPYGEHDAPDFFGVQPVNFEFNTQTGAEANQSLDLEEIALNDTTPNFAVKIVVTSLETSKYVDLKIEANEISPTNQGFITILLDDKEETEFTGSIKPTEAKAFLLEYHVDSYSASAITETFGAKVTISQGGAYTKINQDSPSVTPNLDIVMNEDGETATIIGVTGFSVEDLILPDYYFTDGANYPITVIGDEAFDSVEILGQLQLPMYLEEIGDYAFLDNQSLTSIIIPNSVITIGNNAFNHGYLTNLIIPNSVTTIGNNAFSGNQLESVTIPSSVTSIGEFAFGSNFSYSLLRLRVDKNNQTYKSIDNVIFTIDEKTIIFSAQKTSYIIPDGVETIGDSAFSGNQLESVTIPDSVTTIGNHAFSGNQLESVTIPNTVATIGIYAFSFNQLESITIPSSVESIGNHAFINSNNPLTTVYIDSSDIKVFDTQGSQGSLIRYAETVYFKEGITPSGSYFTSNFTQQTPDQTGYVKYTRNP